MVVVVVVVVQGLCVRYREDVPYVGFVSDFEHDSIAQTPAFHRVLRSIFTRTQALVLCPGERRSS